MENHHFLWVNQLFLWPFSIAIMLVYQRVNGMNVKLQSPFASIKSFRCACRIRCESLQASKYKKHRKYLYGTMDRTDRTCFQLRRYQTYYNIYIYIAITSGTKNETWHSTTIAVRNSCHMEPQSIASVAFNVLASSGLFARNQLAHTWQPLVMLVLH